MKIWALSDIHFNSNGSRDMQEYGKIWRSHASVITEAWRRKIKSEDIVLVTGDISWATRIDKALNDLKIVDALPGKKIIVKGNHDHWWKGFESLANATLPSIFPLAGNALSVGSEVFCGTEGWLSPNDPCFDNLDHNFFNRELSAMETSLDMALENNPRNGIHLLLHFPPFTTRGDKTPFFKMLKKYPVKTCTYGHFHLPEEWEVIPKGWIEGTFFQLASTDYLNHSPVCIWDTKVDKWTE